MGYINSVNNLFRGQKVVNSATNYVVLDDDVIINISDTSVARSVTLPTPSINNVGKFFVIKDTSGGALTNNITITPASGTIDNAANYKIESSYGSVVLYSDGSNYFSQSEIKESPTEGIEYLGGTLASDIAMNVPNTFQWVDLVGNLTESAGLITLKAEKTYLLFASLVIDGLTAGSGYSSYQWYDSLDAPILNSVASTNYSASQERSYSTSYVIFTPTVDTDVKLRVVSAGTGGTQTARALGSAFFITQIGGTGGAAASNVLASFRAVKLALQSIPDQTSPYTNVVQYQAPVFDTTSSFNETTGEFTAPRTGRYMCVGSVGYATALTALSQFEVSFAINGTTTFGVARGTEFYKESSGGTTLIITPVLTATFSLTVGDTISMSTRHSGLGAATNISDSGTLGLTFFEVHELANKGLA